ncbi:protein FAM177A1 [Toxorhynchites rutilus septentrionalis]|uniref:protein FAM177A1 n=1 Tax=Toxorhynchites rutilus septentrionalis TaxID=329112 RepID=UPI0024793AA6|nr:protein FAM177A1 [Toxorhynchites rutilus septentrionalis]
MTKIDIPMNNKVDATATFIQNEKDVEVQVRAPKRILHFSDGTLEEYSDNEEDQVDAAKKHEAALDETKMNWSDWMMHKTCKLGSSVLAGCDYVGEGLASMLGITTPKYSFEIEEFKRIQAEQQAEDRAIQNFVEQNRPTSSSADPSTESKPDMIVEFQSHVGNNPEDQATASKHVTAGDNEIQKY